MINLITISQCMTASNCAKAKFNVCVVLLPGDVSKTEYCTVELTEEKYQAFVYAVKSHYWYQMYIDDLPIWGIYFYLAHF